MASFLQFILIDQIIIISFFLIKLNKQGVNFKSWRSVKLVFYWNTRQYIFEILLQF